MVYEWNITFHPFHPGSVLSCSHCCWVLFSPSPWLLSQFSCSLLEFFFFPRLHPSSPSPTLAHGLPPTLSCPPWGCAWLEGTDSFGTRDQCHCKARFSIFFSTASFRHLSWLNLIALLTRSWKGPAISVLRVSSLWQDDPPIWGDPNSAWWFPPPGQACPNTSSNFPSNWQPHCAEAYWPQGQWCSNAAFPFSWVQFFSWQPRGKSWGSFSVSQSKSTATSFPWPFDSSEEPSFSSCTFKGMQW